MQTHPEELYNAIFRIVTHRWPFTRNRNGPANSTPFGKFHCSVRCMFLNEAVRAERRRKNRTNRLNMYPAQAREHPRITRKFHPPAQTLMVQRHRHPPTPIHPLPTLPALGCSSVLLLSQHNLYITAKDIVKLTNPFPTQQVLLLKT